MLWYPLSPVAALWLVASVSSSFLPLSDECLAPSFIRRLARQAATNARAYTIVVRVTRSEPKVSPASSSRSPASYSLTLNTGVVDRTWVVGCEFEYHVHHKNAFLKKSEFPHINNLINALPGFPGINKNCGLGTYGPVRRPRTPQF